MKGYKFNAFNGDILDSSLKFNNKFDMIWCYGVVHHTGNTILAIKNIKKLLKNGGYLFIHIYGEPNTDTDFIETNQHNYLREKTKRKNFEEKIIFLKNNFSPDFTHTLFDAISPTINELYTFNEIKVILTKLGFEKITRTIKDSRNHHIIAKNKE